MIGAVTNKGLVKKEKIVRDSHLKKFISQYGTAGSFSSDPVVAAFLVNFLYTLQ